MLRITTSETGGEFVMRLEGCLCGPWVSEVAACWIDAAINQPGRLVRVELDEVSRVDRAGRELMTLMHASGVHFAASGLVMPEIVREIAARVRNPRRS